MFASGRYCCKSPKLPGANFSAVKNPTDDRRSMWPQSRYRGRQRGYLQAMRSPISLHESRVYSQKKFDHECKKTFATKSAPSGGRLGPTLCPVSEVLRTCRDSIERAARMDPKPT